AVLGASLYGFFRSGVDETFPQLAVQDLSGRRARHLRVGDEGDRTWALVAGDASPAPVEDLPCARRGARVKPHPRVHRLTPRVVRYPDDCDFLHGRMGAEQVPDLRRIHVLAAADDHFALA